MSSTVTQSKAAALKQMEGKIAELPLLPQVLVKLLQLNRTSEDYFDDFELLVMEDPTFAVRVIALANSASSAPVAPITSIRDAITRMGATTIADLVASLAVQKVFMPSKPSEIRLWTHSVQTACATEAVAKLVQGLEVDPGRAYLSGLLHDIGRFVMMEHASEELQAVDESNWHTPEELVAADVDVYKYTHSELGFLACDHWGLPNAVSNVVRDHHADLPAAITPGSDEATTYCVQVADRLSIFVLETGDVPTDELRQLIESDCIIEIDHGRGLDPEALLDRIPSIQAASDRLIAALGL